MAEEAQNIEEVESIDIEITDEKIEKAAVPEHRRVEDEDQRQAGNTAFVDPHYASIDISSGSTV